MGNKIMEEIIKKRKLNFQPQGEVKAKQVADALMGMKGVKRVDVLSEKQVEVHYDLRSCNLEKIEDVVSACGGNLNQGFWSRFIRGWIHFTEENEYNASRTGNSTCHG